MKSSCYILQIYSLLARDQRAVLLHAPNGTLPFEIEETVLVKSELKEEILELLENVYSVSYETIYRGIRNPIRTAIVRRHKAGG